ncbi:MAG: patatin-like phospholipase family protein, partial [Kiritimatiellae bacterium]|nr:patatin-like phospholipase family protein [Kiritimatiellia bacterium]
MRIGRKKRVALVLGSGAARGWAHIGVIRALEEAKVPVNMVVGTSIGALVGGSYASGRLPILEEVVLRLDWRKLLYYFLDVSLPRSGLIDGARIEQFVREHVQPTRIEDLPIPFRAVATDLLTGREVVFDKGDLIEAIRASLAVAGILTPVQREGAVLVDGGLVNPLPVSVARAMGATFVIASEINLCAYDQRLQARAKRRAPEWHGPAAQGAPTHIRGAILQKVDQMLKRWDPGRLTPMRRWLDRENLPNILDIVGTARDIMQAQVTVNRLKT